MRTVLNQPSWGPGIDLTEMAGCNENLLPTENSVRKGL